MNVLDIMAKSPALCTVETPLRDAARMMVEHDCGAIPVVASRERPQPVGIITDRDIIVRIVAEGKNPAEHAVRDAMSGNAVTIPFDRSIEECARVMAEYQIRRVPVVDADGAVIGIVSQADIALNAPAGEIAEVVREVSEEDETDVPMGGAYSG